MAEIPQNLKSIIKNNILAAKNKREQLKIEAELHDISVGAVKDILKEYGISLRCLNGFVKKDAKPQEAPEPEPEQTPEPERTSVKQAIDVICARVSELTKQRDFFKQQLNIVNDELTALGE